ncbi:hypothetical protein I3843_16G071100 [Carya illinoinensis]|nr:hypothetical protein I3760_16G073400 [Carya illinoinensis]KAG7941894.1 hypothetical protein I3843_16G071100 [Carya illinoinensis]
MLEQLLIFTRGGLILWTCKELVNALKGSAIDALIGCCLLEERFGGASYYYDAAGAAYTLKWNFHNELGLVFVAAYQRILHLMYDPKRTTYSDFNETFRQLKKEAEARAEDLKRLKQVVGESGAGLGPPRPPPPLGVLDAGRGPRPGPCGVVYLAPSCGGGENGGRVAGCGAPRPPLDSKVNGGANSIENGSSNVGAFDVNKLQKLRAKGLYGKPKKKITKKNRVWDDSPPQEKLDFTDDVGENGDNMEVVAVDHGESMMDKEESFSSESEVEDDEEVGKDSKPETKKKGWFSTMFQSITGKANLEKSDLEPALKALKDRLMMKDVAEEIAEKLCESVAASLEGKKLASFTRISSTVQAAMEEALVRILTPRCSIDILRDVHAAREQRKPYVVVFVGVNGVGKSTNLAKVAYWLLQHEINVMMAACDTFQSEAVEQLRTHARRLQLFGFFTRRGFILIFEKGYEKDPALVAKEAVQEATHNGSDVVLVDTAGRMQDNELLMRALSKLIYLNNPDLVLFVGEALIGNDVVDQLSSIKVADLLDLAHKVGVALSLVYICGAPIMFVGCGPLYTDLKKFNVKSIVNTLNFRCDTI